MTDDDLIERLQRTFSTVADASPVPTPPPLTVAPRARPRRVPLLVGAAAALVLLGGAVAVVVDAPDESVRAGPSPDADEPAPTPATIGPDGRIVARGTAGTLEVVAIATADESSGLVTIEVEVLDAPASAAVAVEGDGIAPASMTVDGCGEPTLDATTGFTVGATATPPGTLIVAVTSDACGQPSATRTVRLELALPPSINRYDGADGPASPVIETSGDARSGLRTDGVDGCLAEVLVDWGDRSSPSTVEVPPLADCAGGATTAELGALEHRYEPGEYVQRITVTTVGVDGAGSQVAFLERRVTVD